MMKKNLLVCAMAFVMGLSLVTGGPALAEYPMKPITLVAPYGPGGASDLAARTLAMVAHSYVGQPVLTINKAGAGGAVGSAYVSKSKGDGYTLLLARIGCNAILPAINPNIPYKWNDFTILGMLELNHFVFVVHADSGIKSLNDLVAALKKSSKKMSYSTSGPSTILNFGPQLLFDIAGLDKDVATMLPYKGGGQAAAALLGKHVDFLGVNLSAVLSQVQAGQLRAIVVTTPERYPAIADVPTARESGYPGLEVISGWSALFGPPNMNKAAVDKWAAALQQVKVDKSWEGMTKKLGSIPHVTTPEEAKAFVGKQYETFHNLAVKLNLIVK
jgi:tripartite-type tricarboxylate transporter receptor subunit TctC